MARSTRLIVKIIKPTSAIGVPPITHPPSHYLVPRAYDSASRNLLRQSVLPQQRYIPRHRTLRF